VHFRVNTYIGDSPWAGKPCRYVTGHLGQLSLPSFGVRKLSPGLWLGVKAGCVHLCRVAGNTVWLH